MLLHAPPPAVVTTIVHEVQNKRGICFHVEKPCFVLDVAPKNKKNKTTSAGAFRTNYYIHRMKAAAKSAQSPDMNMSLNEIRTGVSVKDHMKFSLLVYLIGVLAIFANLNR